MMVPMTDHKCMCGAAGIGEAVASRFVSEGSRVVFTGRREGQGMALEARLGGPSVARYVQADHTRAEDCTRCVGVALEAFGRIDILFNNAGSLLSALLLAACWLLSWILCSLTR